MYRGSNPPLQTRCIRCLEFRIPIFEFRYLKIKVCFFDLVFVILNHKSSDTMADFLNLEEITKRLRTVVEASKMSAKDFALGAGIPQASLSQMLNEKQVISVATINKVIEHYPNLVDPYEFLFGTPAPSSDPYEMGLFPSQMVPSTGGDKSSEGMREIIRTQSEEIVKLKTELALRSDKEIDRIMVFYTDNSFKTFRCND